MKKIIYLLIFLSLKLVAQNNEFPEYGGYIGLINDSDGYTNLRESQSSSSQIIGKIKKNEEFRFIFPKEKGNYKWAKVKTNKGKIGFVYFNRIYQLRKNNCTKQMELVDQNWDKIYAVFGIRKIDSIKPNLSKRNNTVDYYKRKEIDKFI